MNEHQRKVMPRIEFQRIADDAVITQVWPDGTRQQLTMPLDQALILSDWIVGSAEDHDRVAKLDPHPSPEEEDEMVAADGCTRTPTLLRTVGQMNVIYDPAEIDRDAVYRHLAHLGIDGDTVTLEPASNLFEADWPVMSIGDGAVLRS